MLKAKATWFGIFGAARRAEPVHREHSKEVMSLDRALAARGMLS